MPAAGLQLLWLVVALSQLPRSLCFTCSEGCKCIWRGGKRYGECPLLELSALPSGMDENLQVLNLTHNLIQALPKHAFVNAGLTNVQKLYLSRCELSHIDDLALFKVTNLIELDLSDNKLSAVPTAALSSTQKLKSLNLNRNPITALADMAFAELSDLTHLEMTECRLESVAAGAFEGVSKLKVLKLDHNLLETLPGRAMAPFSSLHEIALDGNRWRCDCELRAFRMWLERNNISFYSPTCHKPLRLNAKPWKSLSSEDMACPPVFLNASSSTPGEMVVHENSNVTLQCRVRADPPAEISWLWKDKPLTNQSEPGQAFVLTQDAGDGERLSELTLRFVQEPLAGPYTCSAQNAAGRVVRNFTLEVTKRPTEVRASAGGGATAEVEMTEQARESTELQQHSYAENPVLGMVIGILVGALAVLLVFGLTLWLCRRRGRRRGAPLCSRKKRTEANSNHKALHNDKQQQQSQPATGDAADVKLLVNPIQKPPRLLMTNSYQGLPSELEPLDPGLCVESSSGVWVVKEHDYSTDESVLSSIPSRAGTIDRRSLARSPIPVPMPVVPPPTDDLHARLHGELTDTLRRTKGDRRPLVERADAQSPLEPYAGLETLRVRDLEHRGPDLIDQIGAAQPPSPRWTPYEHPSAYYRAAAGTPQSCYPPSIPEAPADGTEV
ncbi:hypothetical protein V5799_010608 [Amblyomma americanum]|uniref:Ig-like domain-containing protein n=1 Tax=Amblyomma americanum TaxID=6943 RepID=A0AAQ4EJK8_AMBAM